MSQNIELVIFDWDGTLFDSVGQIVASLQYAAQQFEQPLTDDAAKVSLVWVCQKSCKSYFLRCRIYSRIFCNAMQITTLPIQKVMHGLVVWQSCWLT